MTVAPDPLEDSRADSDDSLSDEVGGAGDDTAGEPEPVEADLAALAREREELIDTTRRLQADFENYRKRMVREQTELAQRAAESLVSELLPVLDSFELAVLSLDSQEADLARVGKGVELVFAELLGVLEKSGLERVEAVGESFDPNLHEAVLHDGSGEGEASVGEVLRSGWRFKGRVLRPAMVKVVHRGAAGGDEAGSGEEAGR